MLDQSELRGGFRCKGKLLPAWCLVPGPGGMKHSPPRECQRQRQGASTEDTSDTITFIVYILFGSSQVGYLGNTQLVPHGGRSSVNPDRIPPSRVSSCSDSKCCLFGSSAASSSSSAASSSSVSSAQSPQLSLRSSVSSESELRGGSVAGHIVGAWSGLQLPSASSAGGSTIWQFAGKFWCNDVFSFASIPVACVYDCPKRYMFVVFRSKVINRRARGQRQ